MAPKLACSKFGGRLSCNAVEILLSKLLNSFLTHSYSNLVRFTVFVAFLISPGGVLIGDIFRRGEADSSDALSSTLITFKN